MGLKNIETTENASTVLTIVGRQTDRQTESELERLKAALHNANLALTIQNEEKEKLAAALNTANKKLILQEEVKEKRAAELIIANKELVFQNEEKEKREEELIIANKELVFQNEEKEKRAAELVIANKELLSFSYVASHDLQEPLRKIQTFAGRILEKENQNLSDGGKFQFQRMLIAARRMQNLIEDLLAFSRLNSIERKFENTDLGLIVEEVKNEFKETIQEKHGSIIVTKMCEATVIPFQFRQLMQNLIGNSLKFSHPKKPLRIIIKGTISAGKKFDNEQLAPEKNYCHISVTDNGIGFDAKYKHQIFEVFERLHSKEEYQGTGIGLAIVKKIVDHHGGIITAFGRLNKGATFDVYIPAS